MSTYGRNTFGGTGRGIEVSSDGSPLWKTGGITIDWATVAAVATNDATIDDGLVVKVGNKYLRYGQVMTKITLTGKDVVTIDATGGTFTLSVVDALGTIQTTSALAYNAAAATVQAALVALSNVGTGNATVTGSAGGPYTITFADALGGVTLTASGASLTGGSGTATVAQTAPGGDFNKFGPYDPAATDGRATLTRGECFILNSTVVQNAIAGFGIEASSDHPGVIYGGRVWKARLIQSGVATHTLALGPTLAELLTAFPMIQPVEN
jgi:hypothetical protein